MPRPSSHRLISRFPLFVLLVLFVLLPSPSSASFSSTFKSRQLAQNTRVHTYGGARIVPGQFLIEVENGSEDGAGERLVKRAGGPVQLLDQVLTLLASPSSFSSSSLSSSAASAKGAFDPSSLPSLSPVRTLVARPGVFTGAVVTLVAGEAADLAVEGVVKGLQGVEGIKRAWPLRLIPPPAPVTRESLPAASGSLTSSALSSLLATSSSSRKRATTSSSADTFGPHVMTGVDKVHAAGQLGAGVKIGVIDTGVDWKNPLLGGCFGKGCLVSFGASFVGTLDGSPTSMDPYTNSTDHGTHVTGIISALPNSLGFSGAAPSATVGHYRVFDGNEETTEDLIVDALLQASADDCDVISMSLGGPVGWLDASPSQVLVERLTSEEGRVVVVSAGNDRAEGLFFANGPASTTQGISVGSVDVTELPAYPFTVLSPRLTLPYLSATPLDLSLYPGGIPARLPLYFTSTDPAVEDDACNELDDSIDLKGKVVVVKRGTCNFVDKFANVQARGAQIVLIYNSPTSGNQIPYFSLSSAPGLVALASLRYADGAQLLELYKTRPRGVFVSFEQGAGMVRDVKDEEGGGVVSYFSEYGPTYELFPQPSLTGPGGNILSTFPISMGGVGINSGTSMSCPFVSASVALVLSAKKDLKLSPVEVRALLATTAKRTATTVNGSTADSVVSQGAGLIQVDKAIATGTILTPYMLALNDTAFFARSHTLTIRNTNPYAMTYTFSSSSAQGLATYSSSSADVLPALSPPALTTAAVSRVTFSSRTLLVPAGATGTVTATFTQPRLARSQLVRFPFYSGFVEVTGKAVGVQGRENELLHVPFFGLMAKMSEMPVFDTTPTIYGDVAYPFIASGDQYQTQANSYGFSSGFDIHTRLAAGTRLQTIDLILADTPFTATIPSSRVVTSAPSSRMTRLTRRDTLAVNLSSASTSPASSLLRGSTSPAPSSSQRLYSSTAILGNINTQTLLPRDYLVDFTATADGASDSVVTFVPSEVEWADGLDQTGGTQYRVLIRALKITADPLYESSYESYVSFPFSLKS
ncbi:hypothetical protein JCM8097_004135 [Rhodosporidiobolus ruineniae]